MQASEMEQSGAQAIKSVHPVRVTALIFLLTGLLFHSFLVNIQPIDSNLLLRTHLLISAVLPLLIGACLALMVFCPPSWTSNYLSSRSVLLAIFGAGFFFINEIVRFTEHFLTAPAVMSGIAGEIAKLIGTLLLAGAFLQWLAEQRFRRAELQKSKNRYRSLVEFQQDMIITTNPEHRLTFVNDAYCKAFGRSKADLAGRPFAPPMHDDDVDGSPDALDKLADPPHRISFEHRVMTDNGPRWIWWEFTAILDAEGGITELQGIGRDITDRKRINRELNNAKNRFRAVFSNTPQMIWELNSQGRVQLANQSAAGTFGLSPEAMTDKTLGELISPELEELFRERADRINSTKKPLEVEDTIPLPGGKRLFRTTLFPLLAASGEVTSIGAISRDITEYRRLSLDLRRSEKLAALGELVAGVAHEIRNPLNTIMGFSELLLSREGDMDPGIRKDIDTIYEASKRVNTITDGLLSFSRKGSSEKVAVDINDILEEALRLKINHLRSWSIQVEKQLTPLPPVNASREQLGQVCLNLINNAEYFMRKTGRGGTLTVRSSREEDRVRVEILDTGPGIGEENLEKIFSPFFTTKPEGEGTGLGLSVGYGIIEEHGGEIKAENREEGGAAFTIVLPAT